MISITVAYAIPKKQIEIPLMVEVNCTVEKAIALSGILSLFSEIDLQTALVGIFGKKVTLRTMLSQNDRVEIYRPLQNDPKVSRRLRITTREAIAKQVCSHNYYSRAIAK